MEEYYIHTKNGGHESKFGTKKQTAAAVCNEYFVHIGPPPQRSLSSLKDHDMISLLHSLSSGKSRNNNNNPAYDEDDGDDHALR